MIDDTKLFIEIFNKLSKIFYHFFEILNENLEIVNLFTNMTIMKK